MATTEQQRRAYLDAMGVTLWTPRAAGAVSMLAKSSLVASPRDALDYSVSAERVPAAAALGWDELEAQVAACTACDLHQTRTQTVFGTGDRRAQWMVIGEAPGAEEDRQGEPFVGRAGQLLNAMLKAAGLSRESVYIANIIKCRPPQNRDPSKAEAASCEHFLRRQIELVEPRLILALGRIAATNLLGTDEPLSRLRGRPHCYKDTGIPVVVTYHPAYLLRTPLDKRKAWDDLKLALSLGSSVSRLPG